MTTYTQKSICPYDCPYSCGFVAVTDGKRILKVDGDPEHPASRGILCRKMRHYPEAIHSDRRILTPMKRIGEKGKGEFVPVSWEEAILEITDHWKSLIRTDGAEAIGYCYYSGVMSPIQRHCCEALFHRMGACQLVKTLCASAKGAGYADVVGQTGCLDPRELKDSDFYLVWGSNMPATRLPDMKTLAQARRAGKKVVQIEVYGEPMANQCDETFLIRPGTDGALALAMMHILLQEGLADEAFLRESGIGCEEFCRTLPSYTPEWAAGITGIPADAIRRLARLFGGVKAPAIILGSGISRYGNGAMTVRLITILSLFTGAWKYPGGGLCGYNPTPGPYIDLALIQRPDFLTAPTRRININQLAAALTGTPAYPPLKSLYVSGANPACSVSDQKRLREGLAREDLFTVVHDRFLSDTARYADFILPAAFSVEQSDVYLAYDCCTLSAARRIIPPPGEAKSNWDTICLLAKGMGFEDDYFDRTEEDMLELVLRTPTPASRCLNAEDRERLLAGGTVSLPFSDHTRFGTPEGKFYLVNPNLSEPMPRYIECFGGPEPLHLVSVPSNRTLNSIFQQHEGMVRERGPMALVMHPSDAEVRGIHDGDRILCRNDLAEVEFAARISSQIAPGAVAAVGIYASSQSPNGLGCNALHHARLSDEGEATTMNDNTVEVARISR